MAVIEKLKSLPHESLIRDDVCIVRTGPKYFSASECPRKIGIEHYEDFLKTLKPEQIISTISKDGDWALCVYKDSKGNTCTYGYTSLSYEEYDC